MLLTRLYIMHSARKLCYYLNIVESVISVKVHC